MIEVPFLSYQQLKDRAQQVLEQSSYSGRFPIEIELIVERDFEIEIVPIVGLQNAYSIDAFLSKDLKTITVDEAVLETRLSRYRFSLAHELGHRVLHEEILSVVPFQTITQWKHYIASIPERQYTFLEYQANTFANALLVPQHELEPRFWKAVDRVKKAGIDPQEFPDACLDSISNFLGLQFEVSKKTLEIRLGKEEFVREFLFG